MRGWSCGVTLPIAAAPWCSPHDPNCPRGNGTNHRLSTGNLLPYRGFKEPLRACESARHHCDEGTVPGHLITEVANAAAPTIFNLVTIAYWICVTPNWLPFAHSVLATAPRGWES